MIEDGRAVIQKDGTVLLFLTETGQRLFGDVDMRDSFESNVKAQTV
jgi:hypothetical protein